jgi:hypothetical protein
MSQRVENLHKRRKKLGLSIYRYYHAFMVGYADKGRKWKASPYKQKKLNAAYWEGRRTRYDYSALSKNELSDRKCLTIRR